MSQLDDLIADRVDSGDDLGAPSAAGRDAGPHLLQGWLLERRLTDMELTELLIEVW